MTFGLTSSGFKVKRLADARSELETAFRQVFGSGIKLNTDSTFGKMIGLLADREAELWEMVEAVYNSQYPNSASDVSLSRLGEFTAITRNKATRSTVTAYLAGSSGTSIPDGTLFAVQDAGDQFRTLDDVTLSGSQVSISSLTRSGTTATATANDHGFSVGRRVFISGANEADYNGLVTIDSVPDANKFTYTVSGSPETPATGTIVADPATAVSTEAVETGDISAQAGTLNQIVNTISGLDRVENQDDATKGTNLETDAEFRERRIQALQGLGSARLEAIRGALLQVNNVTEAKIFENPTNSVDSDGRPPNSLECLVIGGDQTEILETVWDKKAAGIELFGSTSGTVTDSQGIEHTSKFSRPVGVSIYIELDLTVNADYPGDSEVESRLLDFGASLKIGDDVVVYPYLIASFDDVPGILDVAIRIGTSASPTQDDNIDIPDTQIADFDSARITISQI